MLGYQKGEEPWARRRDAAGPLWPQRRDAGSVGDRLSERQQSLSDFIRVCFLLSWAVPLGFFLSPGMPWKVCPFHQLLSPLKMILFYATHTETDLCLSLPGFKSARQVFFR